MRLKRILWISVAIVSLSAGLSASGQNYDRRFARISFIEGSAVFRHTGDSDWVAGSINTPLQEQDRIYVPLKSRAELEFDDGSFLRMAEDTEVRIIRLDPAQIRVELPVGLTTIRHTSDVDFHLDSPSASVHLLQKGTYRIEVPQDGSLDVMVQKGTAEILRGGATLRVRRNEAISVPAEASAQVAYRPIDREDAWDTWNDRRDASVLASVSRRYIPSDVYLGAYELDRYGTWVDIADYGHCWRPLHVSYGWSPYRYGRWIYRPYWGWTWVSYEEWGWLPYHYGRWYYHPVHSWCWVPHSGFGLSFGFHFWSPGLVHFYHYGGGMHWVPLGPRDYYHNRNYFYNVSNVTYNNYYIQNIQNVRNNNLEHLPRDRGPQNLNVHNAVVSLDDQEFLNGRSGSKMRVPGQDLVAHGRSFSSGRDVELQPTAFSRSPRPEVDVQKMGIVDVQRDARGGASSQVVSRSVRTIIPGGATGEAVRSANRDAGGGMGGVSTRDRAGSANTNIPPANVRVIPGGSNRTTVDQEAGRRDVELRTRDQRPASNELRQEPTVNSGRRVIPGSTRSIDSNPGPAMERDRQRNDGGSAPSNRRVIPGGDRQINPSPGVERDRQRNEGGSAPSNRRVIPGSERPATPPPTVERDQQRNEGGNAPSNRRVIPGGDRPANPPPESERSVRSSPSFGFSGGEAARDRSASEWSSSPRVRVITPESSAPRRESAPTYSSPVQRDSGFMDRGARSIDRSPGFAAPQYRGQPSMRSSSPSMGSSAPAMRTPQNRSSHPERRPNNEQ